MRLVEPSAFTKISALGVEEQRVFVVVDLTDPLATRPTLGDNFRVEAKIETWSGKGILKVPAGALFQRGANWQTFVVEGKSAKLQNVTIGRSNGLETEIVEGLGEGLRIIVYPGDQVTDGARIVAINGSK